jgi:hypothetical protein
MIPEILAWQGLALPLVVKAAALAAGFAFADRAFGDGKSFKGEKAAILLAVSALGFALGGVAGLALAVVWLIAARSIGWDVFGGSATPDDARGYALTLLRHAVPIPFALMIAHWTGLSLVGVGLLFAGYALAATALAAWYGAANTKAIMTGSPIGKQNVTVELGRGAAYGLALAAAVTL